MKNKVGLSRTGQFLRKAELWVGGGVSPSNTICAETITNENQEILFCVCFRNGQDNILPQIFCICFHNDHVGHAQATTTGDTYEMT